MASTTSARHPWLLRVLKKWLWVLGIPPLLLDYASAYLPRNVLPPVVSRLIETGAIWPLTIVLLAVGLLASAYLVYREDQVERAGLASEILALKERQPQLSAALASPDGSTTETIVIPLAPIPQPPDFDAQVEEKRRQLLAHRPSHSDSPLSERVAGLTLALERSFSEPNPDFEDEVREYLPRYRDYLVQKYEVRLPRAFHIRPIVSNMGTTAATSVVLEIEMPPSYAPPRPHQVAQLEDLDDDLLDVFPEVPDEPRPTKPRFEDVISSYAILPHREPAAQPAPDPNEPRTEKREGHWYIVYDIPRIVPKRVNNDLKPFPIWVGDLKPPHDRKMKGRIYCAELPAPAEAPLLIRFV